jgi:hypothetical protein
MAQANERVSDPPSARPMNRVGGLIDRAQAAAPSTPGLQSQKGPIVIKESKHDTGPLLREIVPLFPEFGAPSDHEIENNVNPNHNWSNQVQPRLPAHCRIPQLLL